MPRRKHWRKSDSKRRERSRTGESETTVTGKYTGSPEQFRQAPGRKSGTVPARKSWQAPGRKSGTDAGRKSWKERGRKSGTDAGKKS